MEMLSPFLRASARRRTDVGTCGDRPHMLHPIHRHSDTATMARLCALESPNILICTPQSTALFNFSPAITSDLIFPWAPPCPSCPSRKDVKLFRSPPVAGKAAGGSRSRPAPRALSRDVRPGENGDSPPLALAGHDKATPPPPAPRQRSRCRGGRESPKCDSGGFEAISVRDVSCPPPRPPVPAGFVRGHDGPSGPIAAVQRRGSGAHGRGQPGPSRARPLTGTAPAAGAGAAPPRGKRKRRSGQCRAAGPGAGPGARGSPGPGGTGRDSPGVCGQSGPGAPRTPGRRLGPAGAARGGPAP